MEIAIGVVVGAILAIAGFILGRSSGRSVGLSEGALAGSPETDDRAALEDRSSSRESELNTVLVEAIGRVSAFLKTNVRKPLIEAGEAAGADELRERIEPVSYTHLTLPTKA